MPGSTLGLIKLVLVQIYGGTRHYEVESYVN